MTGTVRFWWIEQGDDPCPLPSFPAWCHKFIVLRDDGGDAHVVASDGRLDQHADIAAAVAGWSGRALPRPGAGPEGGLSGGGLGGDRFPGHSQAFGPPPEDVVQAVRGLAPPADPGVIPAWVDALVRERGCASVAELAHHAEADVFLSVFVDRIGGAVELELWSQDGQVRQAVVSLAALETRFGGSRRGSS